MIRKVTLALALALTANAATAERSEQISVEDRSRLTPISIKDQQLPELMLIRCHNLANAVVIYANILAHNPVHGTDPDRKAPFRWAENMMSQLGRQGAGAKPEDMVYVGKYMNAFGAVTFPSNVPNMPLYQTDKAICLAEFGS